MNNIDQSLPDSLLLDGRTLRVFLEVLDSGSITVAANNLGVTQSAVSHTIEKLRALVHDPLFVKSGRGILPTAHALGLQDQARQLLDDMQSFTKGSHFEPGEEEVSFTVASNDYVRNLLVPPFYRRIRPQLKSANLRIITSGWPTPALLRERQCDLILTPSPPDGADIMQKRLLGDRYMCFFDDSQRKAPKNLEEYQRAEHIVVVYDHVHKLHFDQAVEEQGIERNVSVVVPTFAAVAPFLQGSTMIASMPGLVHQHLMQSFGMSSLPFKVPVLSLYMVWHKRHQDDPAHRWLRSELEASSKQVLTAVSQRMIRREQARVESP